MKISNYIGILTLALSLPVFAADKPNVVVIFADDLGYGDLSCYGASKLKTPNIDKLASEGRRFTDAHSASAVCTPSRYALITGRYPFRRGLSRPVFLKTGLVIDQERKTVADVMKSAGYSTACIGKWHLGFGGKTPDWNGELKPGPLELGFDYYYGVPVVNSHPPFVYVENHRVVGLVPEDPFVYGKKAKTQEIHEKMRLTEIGGADAAHALYDDYAVGTHLAEKSVEWIEKNKEGPFFLYLSTTNIHHPFTPAKRFQGTSECGLYGDFVHELDWIVGEVMATLEKNGLAENTLVIFTSDNGGMINETGQEAIKQGHQLNGELLGFKFDAWEGGHRVPFIARWPNNIESGTVSDQLISNIDLMATMAALTDQPLKPEDGPDSFNILPALIDNPAKPIRSELVLSAAKGSHLVLRQGDWAYITGKGGGGFNSPKIGSHGFGGPPALKFAGQTNSDVLDGKLKAGAPPQQLYNLKSDLQQTRNVIEEKPEKAASLSSRLAEIKAAKGTRPGLAAESATTQQPNIVFIFADDLGYGDVGCYGATKIQTPNIDQLAREGRRFTDAHSASAVCTPSRYALLTGEYPFRANEGKGMWGPLPWYSKMLIPTDTFIIGDLLQAKGYATSCFGKWHLGWGDKEENDWSMPLKTGPNQLGFDYYWGVPRVNCNPPYVYVENDMIVGYDPGDPLVILQEGETPTPIHTFPPEASVKQRNMFRGAAKAHELYDDEMIGTRLTEEAVKWIGKNKEKPFFLLFNTVQIHHPFTPAPRFKGASQCGLYGDYTHEFDWMVGELVKSLEANGLTENTLIIVTSDNGGMFNRAGFDAYEDGHKINGELLGYKFGAWEGGHRVPFIAKWPGKIPAGTVSDQLVCSIDMMATFAAITGQKVDPRDSANILPALVGDPQTPVREELVLAAFKESHLSLRKGKWMYIPAQGSAGFGGTKPGSHGFAGPAAVTFTDHPNSDVSDGKIRSEAPPAQLYDMVADVTQTRNLYNQFPDVVKGLDDRLKELKSLEN